MNREECVIAICDKNENYLLSMEDGLGKYLKKPYRIEAFTSVEAVAQFLGKQNIYILIVSESTWVGNESDRMEGIRETIILSEEGTFDDRYVCIDRYQAFESVLQEIMSHILDRDDYVVAMDERKERWKVIGFYSPIKRCLQTTFALSLGQLLAETHKVLYLSFENFPIVSGFQNQNMQGDMTDLLYYFDCDREKLLKKIPIITKSMNGMDYLPSAQSFFDTYERTGKKWLEFFELLEKITDYDILILDLSESIQGLLDVLGYCDRIYTIGKEDENAKVKMMQYEEWMKQHTCANIIEKTKRFSLPSFENLPNDITTLTHGELAGYANAVIQEDLYG